MATGLENLKIYQMAKNVELKVHEITKKFPRDEFYRSVDQLRRSSSSATNNIAEAYNKKSIKEKCHILRDMVITEAEETESNILRCGEKKFITGILAGEIANDYVNLKKAVFGYIRFLNKPTN